MMSRNLLLLAQLLPRLVSRSGLVCSLSALVLAVMAGAVRAQAQGGDANALWEIGVVAQTNCRGEILPCT